MGSSSSSSCPSSSSKYGDISKMEPYRGWSDRQSRIRKSEAMASKDSGPMQKYKNKIHNVAGEKDIHPALIAAIISRESSAGETIKNKGGYGDFVNGKPRAFGLMQVDFDKNGGNHTPRGEWDSEEHLRQATDILIYFIGRIQNKFPRWSKENQLKGGIAAYNKGDGAVTSDDPDDMDENTTHKNYSDDVVARAQWFMKNSYED